MGPTTANRQPAQWWDMWDFRAHSSAHMLLIG